MWYIQLEPPCISPLPLLSGPNKSTITLPPHIFRWPRFSFVHVEAFFFVITMPSYAKAATVALAARSLWSHPDQHDWSELTKLPWGDIH